MSEPIEIWGVYDPNISAQLALADRLNLFTRETGLNVTCRFIESGTTMADDVVNAAHPPFAVTQTPITALLLHEYGLQNKIVAPLADIAGAQQVIIRKASGIQRPQDLEGKPIGMAHGAAVMLALKNMAKDCNLNLAELRIVDLLPHEQIEAFQAGQLDVIASWEPWTTKAQVLGGEMFFSGSRSEIPGSEGNINWLINQSCLIVPDEQARVAPDKVIAILNVLRKATDLLNHHRTRVIDPLAEFFQISRVELLIAMQKNHYALTVTNLFRLGILSFRDFLYETGQLTRQLAEEQLYQLSYLKEVDPSLIFLEETTVQDVAIVEKNGIYYLDQFHLNVDHRPLTFLLADDSRYVRAALAKAVRFIGGQIIGEAATGSEVIERFAHLRPDVITMDLSMPGVSGIEALKILLQIDPDLAIVVISGTDLREVREEVFHLGVKMFITKPFDPMQVAGIFAATLYPVG